MEVGRFSMTLALKISLQEDAFLTRCSRIQPVHAISVMRKKAYALH